MMNSSKTPLKESSIQQVINVQIIYLGFLLLGMSILSAICKEFEKKKIWYIGNVENDSIYWSPVVFVILYNNVIPISLQITLEMVKIFQALFVGFDREMFHPNPKAKLGEEEGTWALARTSNLNEELGQIKYVFSDKTGTLTQNIMAFKFCGINGKRYSEKDKQLLEQDSEQEPLIHDFMTILSVCHTVIPEVTSEGTTEYNASSPDEKAFVDAARDYGFEFLTRSPEEIRIRDWKNEEVVVNPRHTSPNFSRSLMTCWP
jgi:phospholipid-transporting ATPase